MTKKIINPIIRGFNPDPAICRVGEDYYIVTSTFEWFPGYQIHHSKDLVNWQLIGRPLDRKSQLDMRGVPDSCGVWAPCITHHEGVFYVLYTNVRSFDGQWKDMPNYLVTAEHIEGPWSEPVYLNSSGFDASFFHDDDGKTWLANMIMDHRDNRFFGGIVLQEYDKQAKQLVGEQHYIFEGTEHGRTEGPHIYKRNGYYYLLTAEGGTGYEHCMTIARSTSLFGPYEVHPENPMLTAKYAPDNPIHKTGHGDLFETHDGQWYTTFLTSRPLVDEANGTKRCITGRETGLEKIEWRDDWPYVAHGTHVPRKEVEAPNWPEHGFPERAERCYFTSDELDINFQALRVPITDDWASLSARKDYLRLTGRDSLASTFDQSLLGWRVEEHHTQAATCVEFDPETFQQMAGLVCYYNTVHYHYLHVYGDDFGRKAKGLPVRKYLNVISCDNFETSDVGAIDITGSERVYMKADFNGAALQFYYALNHEPKHDTDWIAIGPVLDGSILSDDYVEGENDPRFHPCFTGAFYGLCCQDLSGGNQHADFAYFDYKKLSN